MALWYLYHTGAAGAGRVQEDVVAGKTKNALDALLAGLDGDGVDDAVADLDAATPSAGAARHKPLVHGEEGGQHRGPPAVPPAVPVGDS